MGAACTFHVGFLDYARHAGFLSRLCQPYRAQSKGKVERFIGYLKRSRSSPRCHRQV
jgi:transposase